MKYYEDMENIKIGDRMKLSAISVLTATCQEINDDVAVFCMDQYLGRIMPIHGETYETSELRKEINSKSILSLFPFDLVPFENGDLVRIPYAEEMFSPENTTKYDICHHIHINQWPLMKDRRNRICFINENIPGWGWLMDKVDKNHFAIVNKLGDMSKCITNEAGGVRLVFQVKIPVIKKEDEEKATLKADYIVQGKTDNPILTISCSMKQELSAKKLIRSLRLQFPNATIYDPFMEPHRLLPIREKRKNYIDYIRSSSTLIAISKSNETIEVGESVSWEVAIAEHFSIPVLYFLDGQVLR